MARIRSIVGLDIGSQTIRALWVELRAGKPRVTRREELRLPTHVPNLQRVVRPWVEEHELQKEHCAIGISGQETVYQPLTLAADDPRTPLQAATIEVAKFNEMASELMSFGVTSFSDTPELTRILIAMARPNVLTQPLHKAKELGLARVSEMVPRPYALYRGVFSSLPVSGGPTLCIHIGNAGTELAVGVPGGILFARAFSCGGRMFSEALARAAGHSLIQAENQKVANKLGDDSGLPAELHETADIWLTEFKSCVAVYRSLFGDLPIEHAVISGGGARLRGFVDYISEAIDIPVTPLAQRVPELACKPDDVIALGQAITALDTDESQPLSLMPQRLRDEMVFRREKPYWIATGVMASLSLGVFLLSAVRVFNKQRDELEQKVLYQKQIDAAITKIENARTQTKVYHERSARIRKLLEPAPRMREVVKLVADSINPDDWVSMICDAETYFAAPPTPPEAKPKRLPTMRDLRRPTRNETRELVTEAPKSSAFDRFIIEGYTPTRSLLTVKELISSLQASELVERADLLGDNLLVGTRWEGSRPMTNLTHFVIELRTNKP